MQERQRLRVGFSGDVELVRRLIGAERLSQARGELGDGRPRGESEVREPLLEIRGESAAPTASSEMTHSCVGPVGKSAFHTVIRPVLAMAGTVTDIRPAPSVVPWSMTLPTTMQ